MFRIKSFVAAAFALMLFSGPASAAYTDCEIEPWRPECENQGGGGGGGACESAYTSCLHSNGNEYNMCVSMGGANCAWQWQAGVDQCLMEYTSCLSGW